MTKQHASILEALALMRAECAGPILFRESDGVPVMVVTALTTPRRCKRAAANLEILAKARTAGIKAVRLEVATGQWAVVAV